MRDTLQLPRTLVDPDAIDKVLDMLAQGEIPAARVPRAIMQRVPVDLDLLEERMNAHPLYGRRRR